MRSSKTRPVSTLRTSPGRNACGRGLPSTASWLSKCVRLGLNPKALPMENSHSPSLASIQRRGRTGFRIPPSVLQKHPRIHQDNIGMHQDVTRTPQMAIRILWRLTDGVYGSYFPRSCQLVDYGIFISITLQVSPWEVVTTGYLDVWMPMAIKGGEVQLTSQIQCR